MVESQEFYNKIVPEINPVRSIGDGKFVMLDRVTKTFYCYDHLAQTMEQIA